MFELSVACKYLIPRRRQLSVSIISLISVLVIALVVWLIVVFFSVTDGLEKSWIQKLTALTAPVRITPTEAYYHSYYYQIDAISEAANYSHKTIREKKESLVTDPYQSDIDEEIPSYWPTPDRTSDGKVKDLVKIIYASLNDIQDIPGLQGQDFELTATHIRLRLLRNSTLLYANNVYGGTTQSALSYPAYLGNFERDNPHLSKTLLAVENQDFNNLLYLLGIAHEQMMDESSYEKVLFPSDILQRRLKHFFEFVTIQQLKTRSSGWTIPRHLFPSQGQWDVCAILKDQEVIRLVVPLKAQELIALQQALEEQGLTVVLGQAFMKEGIFSFMTNGRETQISPVCY